MCFTPLSPHHRFWANGRSMLMVGKNGKIVYVQLVPNIAHQPNYAPVLTAARQAAAEP